MSLLTAAAVVPAMAATVRYSVTFSGSGSTSSALPTGTFEYDAGSGFANFIVSWESATFDLTSAANNPTVAYPDSTGCNSTASGHEYGFLLLTQSLTGCSPQYPWAGMYFGATTLGTGFAQLFFFAEVNSIGDAIGGETFFPMDPAAMPNFAVGTWTVSEASSVPEPATAATAVLAALALAFAKRRRIDG